MHYRRGLLSKFKVGDRAAVAFLRGGGSSATDPEMREAFAMLRDRLEQAGLQILPTDARTVSQSELFVLAWLAALQRNRLEPAIETRRIDAPEAQLCARLLDRAGYRLDYHHVVRLTGPDDRTMTGSGPNNEAYSVWPLAESSAGNISQRNQIIRELAKQGPMSTAELMRLGASRQAISNMVKRGLLKRIRFGVYDLCRQ